MLKVFWKPLLYTTNKCGRNGTLPKMPFQICSDATFYRLRFSYCYQPGKQIAMQRRLFFSSYDYTQVGMQEIDTDKQKWGKLSLADFVLGCSGLRVQACSVPQANFKQDQRCRNDTSKSKISRHPMVKVKVFVTRNQLIAVLGQIGQLCPSWVPLQCIVSKSWHPFGTRLSNIIHYLPKKYNNMKGLIRLHQPKPS